jgi:cephalosporin hydroxylase
MAIIRFSDDEVFSTDSSEYEILANAAKNISGVEGAVVEIGSRRGGSAKIIIDALVESGNNNRSMFCIDPYGNIDFECTNLNISAFGLKQELEGDPKSKDLTDVVKLDYNNDMRNRIVPSLYFYAYQARLNFTFFALEDTEFMSRYSDGVPVYDEVKKIEDKYAFVFFDGPHTNKAVEDEVRFFGERAVVGSMFVFDDIWMYDHDMIEGVLEEYGFEVSEKKQIKASYKKVK